MGGKTAFWIAGGALIGLLAAIVTCSGSPETQSAPHDDAGAGDSATPDDGRGPGRDAEEDGGAKRNGMVELNQTVDDAGYSVLASADFIRGWAFAPECVLTQINAACTTALCPDADAGAPPRPPTAGRITITGGKLDGELVLIPLSDGTYFAADQNSQAFAAGDLLSVRAEGDAIPAFSGETVVAPNDIDFKTATLSRTFPPPGPVIPIDRTRDWAVSWLAGTVGLTEVQLSTYLHGIHQSIIICYFDATSGSGTVPAAALQALDSSSRGIAFVQPLNMNRFAVGDFEISFVVDGTGLSGQISTN